MISAPTLQLLEWIDEGERSYAETMEAWRSHCPRLAVWEDALADGLVRVRDGRVELTPEGRGQTPSGSDPAELCAARGLGPRAFSAKRRT